MRVRLGAADTALQLWRAKWLMLFVFLPIALFGIAIALLVPTKYPASTRLLVRLGQEYVFDPVVGDAAKGAFPQQEEVLQAETELARSPVIAERVIKRIGLDHLYPNLAVAKARAKNGESYAIDQRALEAFGKDLDVRSAPKSSILRLTYAHPEPQLAADTLNAFVAEYLMYRREVLSRGEVAGLSEQRGVIESRLEAADKGLQAYLARNGLSDFDAENTAATKLFADISDEASKVDASLSESAAKATGLRRLMQTTPREVDLYVETTSEQDLMKMRVERQDLLTRYRPDSRAVQDIDKRIAQLETFLKSAPAAGLRRIGPNPTFQALEADEAVQSATVSGADGQVAGTRAAEGKRATPPRYPCCVGAGIPATETRPRCARSFRRHFRHARADRACAQRTSLAQRRQHLRLRACASAGSRGFSQADHRTGRCRVRLADGPGRRPPACLVDPVIPERGVG